MKKIKFLFGMLAVIGLASLFSACDGTSSATVVNIKLSDNVTAAPGEVVSIGYELSADVVGGGELGEFSVTDPDMNEVYSNALSGTSTVTDTLEYTVPSDAVVGTDIALTFTALDGKSGESNTKTFLITVEAGYPEIVTATTTSNYVSTTLSNDMIFDLGETSVEMQGGDFSDGELAFVWQNTYGYSVVSPNATWIATLYGYNGITYSISDKQETKIMSYTGQWADLTQEAIDALTITSETVAGGGNGVQNLTEGDIVVFETADGRKGALKVNTNAKVSKNMTADLAYQATPGTAGK